MATGRTRDFKDPQWMTVWLDAALKKEKEKYKKEPVTPDLVPGYEMAQAWGYVVAGYFLIEESFKALLHLRKKEVPFRHSLTMLFELLDSNDMDILREYYIDYRATAKNKEKYFLFETLDDFLKNLDGNPNKNGNRDTGSFDWRYFLIEEQRGENMPMVSVKFMHEIVYGCTRMVEHAYNGRFNPAQHTRSLRRRWKRARRYSDWFTVRMNTAGWKDLGDRWEILWGPDYRDRYDLICFENKKGKMIFSKLPENTSLPILDKRREIEEFDVEEGFRSIGISRISRLPNDEEED